MKDALILGLLVSFLICLLFELKNIQKNMRINETEKIINTLKRTNVIRIVGIYILVFIIFLKPSLIITILSIFNIVMSTSRILRARRLIKLLVEKEELINTIENFEQEIIKRKWKEIINLDEEEENKK